MHLKTSVYAAQIANLTDARYFAARGVEWLGFDCNPASPTYLPLEQSRAVREWVDGVKIVAEFGQQSPPDVLFHLTELRPDALLIPATLPERDFELLNDQSRRLFVVVEHSDVTDWSVHLDEPRYQNAQFVLKAATFSEELHRLVRELSGEYPIYLDVALTVPQLTDLPGRGIVVRGGEEEKVGYKSFDELDELLDALEILE